MQEMLSLSAPHGLFRPFEDEDLAKHLQLQALNSIQHLDTGSGTWITILRNSPPVIVKSNAIYRFKEVDNEITLSVLHEPPIIRTSGRLMKTDSLDSVSDVFNTPSKTDTVMTKREGASNNSIATVGSRPCKLSHFPGNSMKEVDDRFSWINENSSFGLLQTRFSAVYSGPFQSSTFHRHQNAWRWLKAERVLERKSNDEPWKDLSQMAWRTMNLNQAEGNPPSETIDLT